MIPIDEWEWYGHPLHFIASDRCRFRMGTKIGGLVVSTVGDYYINHDDKKPTTIGWGRLFETMVFKDQGDAAECGCPEIDGDSLAFAGYNDAKAAREGHMAMCRRVANGEIDARPSDD